MHLRICSICRVRGKADTPSVSEPHNKVSLENKTLFSFQGDQYPALVVEKAIAHIGLFELIKHLHILRCPAHSSNNKFNQKT